MTVDIDYQLTVDHAALIAAHDVVVFADAMIGLAVPFRFAAVDAAQPTTLGSHQVSPEAALALARMLFGQAPPGWMLAIAGDAFGKRSPVPVYSGLMCVDVVLTPGARLKVPADHIERAIFIVSGEIEVVGQTGSFGEAQLVVLKPGAEIVVQARGGAHLMLVGGEPFAEPRHIYWNFVSSSQAQIDNRHLAIANVFKSESYDAPSFAGFR